MKSTSLTLAPSGICQSAGIRPAKAREERWGVPLKIMEE